MKRRKRYGASPLVIAGCLLVCFICWAISCSSEAQATSWNTPAHYAEPQDSVHVAIKTIAGAVRDSVTGRASVQTYDTTWTVSDDSAYEVVYYSWADGSDSAATWTWTRDERVLPTGTGPHSVVVYTIDTLGTDTLVPQVRVSVKDTTGKTILGGGNVLSGNDGTITFTLNTGYYTFVAEKSMYIFGDSAVQISGNVDSLHLDAYNVNATAKSASVTVVVARSDNTYYEGVLVSAYLARANVVDSLGRAIVNNIQRVRTNSVGQAVFTCMWSSYMVPATDWIFTVHKPAVGGSSIALTIPDSSSYTVSFLR